METTNILISIIIYLVLPVVVIFGVMALIRRKREKDAGHTRSMGEERLSMNDLHDQKEDEGREARHHKTSPQNIDPETGRQPGRATDPETSRTPNQNTGSGTRTDTGTEGETGSDPDKKL